MNPRNSASCRDCKTPRSSAFALLAAAGFGALALCGTVRAQTLTGATVQLGQTSLSLPQAAGSIYVYGMGTGGALPATNFAQGPYTQVTDAGGEVVAGLAMTASNADSFTTQCADFAVAGIGVSGFKTVSASYAANNQPHPTSASDSFLVSDPAVVVVFAIAGGEDHLELRGLPGLLIDAQKAPDQSHGIAIAIAHATLQPGQYTVTETTEGDPGRDSAHEGDLIGVFVFTGGSGAAAVVTSPPSPPHGQQGGGNSPYPPPMGLPGPVAPYAFDGARAQYEFHYGRDSSPVTVTISTYAYDPQQPRCKVAIQFTGPLAALSTGDDLLCSNSQHPFWASPSDLERLWDGSMPANWSGSKILHNAVVSVPAGRFVTEEIYSPQATAWYDSRSGLLVRAQGDMLHGADQQIPALKGVAEATVVLTATNIPVTQAPFNPLRYLWIVVLVLVAGLVAYVVARTAKGRGSGQARVVLTGSEPSATVGRSPARGPAITSAALDRLAKLKQLLDAGLITSEEFQQQKAKLLGHG